MRKSEGFTARSMWELACLMAAVLSSAVLVFIVAFVLGEAWPAFRSMGLLELITGTAWSPGRGLFGLMPMIAGTFAVTAIAVAMAVPVSLGTSVFLTQYAPPWAARIVGKAVDLLAGIPSVVYGLFGIAAIVPAVRKIELAVVPPGSSPSLTVGYSVIAAATVLGVMVTPTVISMTCDALRAVPADYSLASLGLGATRWQTVTRVLIPAASPGILAGVILGTARAIGETMAVLMVSGNAPLIPRSLFLPVRTLTTNIAAEIGYATGIHESALFADGAVLLLIVLGLSVLALRFRRRINR